VNLSSFEENTPPPSSHSSSLPQSHLLPKEEELPLESPSPGEGVARYEPGEGTASSSQTNSAFATSPFGRGRSHLSESIGGLSVRPGEGIQKGSEGEGASLCVVYVTGGDSNSVDLNWAQQLADETGVPVATLFHIPNQPLWDLWEDDLIAHAFDQYVDTGEADWPLLFPMVQSVVAAMNALESQGFTKFIVHGASKRGWTSWLAGIIGDERVVAIAPEVFDNLNMPAQMAQQLAYWGTYSPMIEPYVSEDLPQRLSDPKVLELAHIVDSYTYLSLLKVPVYIIQGTNDPFWTVDSLRLYWDAIPGQKWVDYAPGCGHCIGSRDHAPRGLPGFVRFVAGTGPQPTAEGEAETWWAWSPDRHFENAEWHQGEPPHQGGFMASFQRWEKDGAVCCSPMKLQELP